MHLLFEFVDTVCFRGERDTSIIPNIKSTGNDYGKTIYSIKFKKYRYIFIKYQVIYEKIIRLIP